MTKKLTHAAVMKLVDIGVSKSPAGNGVRVRVPPAAPVESEKAITLAYIVGVALGDGNLSCPNGRATRLRVTCDTKYPKLVEEIVSALQILLPKNKVAVVQRPGNCLDISVYSNRLNDWMPWSVGQGSKKLQDATIPGWIQKNTEYSKHCLRGLIQTDGCIYNDRGYQMVNFTNNSKVLAEDVHNLLAALDYKPKLMVVDNAGFTKYTTRVARITEVKRLIEEMELYKA